MNREQEFIITLLSDYLNNEKTLYQNDLDWPTIRKISHSHQIDGIVYYQCKSFLPKKTKQYYENAFYAAIFSYKNIEKDRRDISASFQSAGIPFIFIKGLDIAKCYPVPFLRTMGDLDLLVHKKDKDLADKQLASLGFECSNRRPDYDWIYYKNGRECELHHQLFYDYDELVNQKNQVYFFNNCWQYVENGRLNWNFHVLFLFAHLRKHLLNRGVGFRMFMDLAMVSRSVPDLDWVWIESKLIKLGMHKFAQVCFSLNEKWFGIKPPIYCKPIKANFVDHATDKIFINGIFGYDNPKSKENTIYNLFSKYNGPRWLSRSIIMIRSLFPSYNNMRYVPHYNFLNERPWLLPIGWIYRYYLLIKGETAGIGNSMKDITLPDFQIREWEEELNNWGLFR